jgi:hypothetical protein
MFTITVLIWSLKCVYLPTVPSPYSVNCNIKVLQFSDILNTIYWIPLKHLNAAKSFHTHTHTLTLSWKYEYCSCFDNCVTNILFYAILCKVTWHTVIIYILVFVWRQNLLAQRFKSLCQAHPLLHIHCQNWIRSRNMYNAKEQDFNDTGTKYRKILTKLSFCQQFLSIMFIP